MSLGKVRQIPRTVIPGTYAPTLPPGEISLSEIFVTLQGEGRHMGRPTTFVRTSHCPLRCTWCDSKYTFDKGTPWTFEKILAFCEASGTRNVCLTGGEPLAQPQGFTLTRLLAEHEFFVEVETSGSIDVADFNRWPDAARRNVGINLDIKCPMSAMTDHNRFENLGELRPQDQLKFIVGDRADYEYARGVLERWTVSCPVWMNPVWDVAKAEDIARWIREDRLPARAGIQLHKILWGDRPGV